MDAPPIAVIPSRAFYASTKIVGFPGFKTYIVISERCLELKDEELEGILAHELFHIKHHAVIWYLLNLLSDISLFGNGFLVVLINSYQNELDSDRFVVKWLEENKIMASNYIDALRIMTLSSSLYEVKDIGIRIREFNDKAGLRTDINGKPLINKVIGKIKILNEFYFGDLVISYIHPSVDERIERIKAMES